MLNAKDVASKKFEKAALGGYRVDEVDEYLKDLSYEISQIQKESNELERKLEVLADKIREYRNDEDALKDALLGAQKQGNLLINESKKQAEKIISESTKKSQQMLKDAENKANAYLSDHQQKAHNILNDANSKAEEIHSIMVRQTEKEQIILQRTRKEVEEFKNKILASYQAHINSIEKLPEKYDTEFTLEISKKEFKKAKFFEHEPVKKEEEKSEDAQAVETENQNDIQNQENEQNQPINESGDIQENVSEETSQNQEELPLFNLNESESNQDSKFGNLQFGKKKK